MASHAIKLEPKKAVTSDPGDAADRVLIQGVNENEIAKLAYQL